ncbi:hypothetical protein [Alteromonas sediminis]|nr:hypothetical protein [Alteromonas sediminis]
MNLVQGFIFYYKKDRWAGVSFFVKARLYQRIIQKIQYANWHYFLSPFRVLTKQFEQTIPLIDDNFEKYGNYFLDKRFPLNHESIVYSLGVLSNTSFDQAVANKHECPIYLYDPSIIATRHINRINHPKFKFEQIGIWDKDEDMLFYTPVYGGSPSMIFEYAGRQFTAHCKKLASVMKANQHTSMDVLKMDIEGAAPRILNHMLDIGVYPDQVLVEFERPTTSSIIDFLDFFEELRKLINRFEDAGYQTYRMPRDKGKYYSIEINFSKAHRKKK